MMKCKICDSDFDGYKSQKYCSPECVHTAVLEKHKIRRHKPEVKEKLKQTWETWHAANKEERKAQRKKFYDENKETITARQRAHYRENREKERAIREKYREQNKEKLIAYRKAYYLRKKAEQQAGNDL